MAGIFYETYLLETGNDDPMSQTLAYWESVTDTATNDVTIVGVANFPQETNIPP